MQSGNVRECRNALVSMAKYNRVTLQLGHLRERNGVPLGIEESRYKLVGSKFIYGIAYRSIKSMKKIFWYSSVVLPQSPEVSSSIRSNPNWKIFSVSFQEIFEYHKPPGVITFGASRNEDFAHIQIDFFLGFYLFPYSLNLFVVDFLQFLYNLSTFALFILWQFH